MILQKCCTVSHQFLSFRYWCFVFQPKNFIFKGAEQSAMQFYTSDCVACIIRLLDIWLYSQFSSVGVSVDFRGCLVKKRHMCAPKVAYILPESSKCSASTTWSCSPSPSPSQHSELPILCISLRSHVDLSFHQVVNIHSQAAKFFHIYNVPKCTTTVRIVQGRPPPPSPW